MPEATLIEAAVGTVVLDDLMVDPVLGTARCQPRDEATVERLVEALRHGETLPRIRIAPILDPLATWCGCADHWQQGPRVAWDLKYRDDAYAHRPYEPKYALIDGLSIVAATRQYLAETEPRRRKPIVFDAVIDAQPVGSVIEVKLRAVDANLRNGRQITDEDLRATFEYLWLGRPAKLKHERWQVAFAGNVRLRLLFVDAPLGVFVLLQLLERPFLAFRLRLLRLGLLGFIFLLHRRLLLGRFFGRQSLQLGRDLRRQEVHGHGLHVLADQDGHVPGDVVIGFDGRITQDLAILEIQLRVPQFGMYNARLGNGRQEREDNSEAFHISSGVLSVDGCRRFRTLIARAFASAHMEACQTKTL